MKETSYIFRQLFDVTTSTYSYIIGDPLSRSALIIDPVYDHIDRDLRILSELDLHLTHIFDTHIHADHVTGSGTLRDRTGAQIVMWAGAHISWVDITLNHGSTLQMGGIEIEALATPGHTDGCTTYKVGTMLFTWDTLLIRKTGRTDFQWWSPEKLYHSIREHIYTLTDETLIYPGHDYQWLTVTTVWEEKNYNIRINMNTSLEIFTDTMNKLDLPYPKYIDMALPANRRLWITQW